jgi:alpha-beta hydrolase superfamily lysophospholipase
MRQVEGFFQGRKEVRLYYRGWLPDTDEKAVVVILHGVAEHCGRYINLAKHLVSSGYATYGFDLRNHGNSEGRKGTVEHFSFFPDDLHILLNQVRNQYSQKRIFLFGHSMGATISLAYSIRYQNGLAGLVLSGSAIRFKPALPLALITLLWPLSVFMPELGIKKLDSSALSHDPEIIRSYDTDPLVFRGRLSARLAIELLWNMRKLERQARLIKIPLLLLHGEADQLVDPQGSRLMFERVSSPDKTLKLYPGLYHEILNEPQYLQVLVDIEHWLGQHV